MFVSRKRTQVNIERFDGFHIQQKFDCHGRITTLFFELQTVIDTAFIEYLKPFGYPVSLPGDIVEIMRDGFFRLMVPLGRTSFHAEFESEYDSQAKELLIQQVYRGAHKIIREDITAQCPEDAVVLENGRFTVDLKKCTYCLDCVT
ncbi:hypothetical protein ACFL6I_02155 [candidate division KSB1 bacterium]